MQKYFVNFMKCAKSLSIGFLNLYLIGFIYLCILIINHEINQQQDISILTVINSIETAFNKLFRIDFLLHISDDLINTFKYSVSMILIFSCIYSLLYTQSDD